MNPFDNNKELVGALMVAAAIIGIGGKLLGYELPKIPTVTRQFVFGCAGLALFVWGYEDANFRVTGLELDVAPAQFVGGCPRRIQVTPTIRTGGGSGTVEFRVNYPSPLEPGKRISKPVTGTIAPHLNVSLDPEKVGFGAHHGTITVHTFTPTVSTSDPQSFSFQCIGARGFKLFNGDGYTALYPDGWRVVENNVLKTTYRRSQFAARTGGEFILIDWGFGSRSVVGPKNRGPGYRFISWKKVQLPSRTVWEWQFYQDGARTFIYRFVLDNGSYSVMSDEKSAHLARIAVDSLAVR